MRVFVVSISALAILCSCARANRDPDILSKEPYNVLRYNAKPNPKLFQDIGDVTVTTRGYEAYVRNTIPKLYEKALEKLRAVSPSKPSGVISAIDFDVYTKRETFMQSYQECHSATEYRPESYQTCSGYGSSQSCHTSYRSTAHQVQKCETKFRQVEADVLYQVAKGRVFARKAGAALP